MHGCIKYHCKHCSYKASTIRHLKIHEKSVHYRNQYPCKHCSYKQILKGPLTKHKREVHVWLKYHCKYCSCKANCKGSLKEHEKSVYEGNKYPCKQCSYQATQKRHLKILIVIIKEFPRQIYWSLYKGINNNDALQLNKSKTDRFVSWICFKARKFIGAHRVILKFGSSFFKISFQLNILKKSLKKPKRCNLRPHKTPKMVNLRHLITPKRLHQISGA